MPQLGCKNTHRPGNEHINVAGDSVSLSLHGLWSGDGRLSGLLPDVLAGGGEPQDRREVTPVQVIMF